MGLMGQWSWSLVWRSAAHTSHIALSGRSWRAGGTWQPISIERVGTWHAMAPDLYEVISTTTLCLTFMSDSRRSPSYTTPQSTSHKSTLLCAKSPLSTLQHPLIFTCQSWMKYASEALLFFRTINIGAFHGFHNNRFMPWASRTINLSKFAQLLYILQLHSLQYSCCYGQVIFLTWFELVIKTTRKLCSASGQLDVAGCREWTAAVECSFSAINTRRMDWILTITNTDLVILMSQAEHGRNCVSFYRAAWNADAV